MNRENEQQMVKIRRVSKVVRMICAVLFVTVMLAVSAAVVAICSGIKGCTITLQDQLILIDDLPTLGKAMLIFIIVFAMLVFCKALRHLYRLFGNFSQGKIFTAESVAQIRHLGMSAIYWAAIQFLWSLGQVPLTSARAKTVISISLTPVVIGVVAFLISWVMDVGRGISEENELTI